MAISYNQFYLSSILIQFNSLLTIEIDSEIVQVLSKTFLKSILSQSRFIDNCIKRWLVEIVNDIFVIKIS